MKWAILVLALSGCAGQVSYIKVGSSSYDEYEALFFCQKSAHGATSQAKTAAIHECMRGKGFAVL